MLLASYGLVGRLLLIWCGEASKGIFFDWGQVYVGPPTVLMCYAPFFDLFVRFMIFLLPYMYN